MRRRYRRFRTIGDRIPLGCPAYFGTSLRGVRRSCEHAGVRRAVLPRGEDRVDQIGSDACGGVHVQVVRARVDLPELDAPLSRMIRPGPRGFGTGSTAGLPGIIGIPGIVEL